MGRRRKRVARSKARTQPAHASRESAAERHVMTQETRRWRTALVITTGVLLALRLVARAEVGFGDSEALYASYALFDEPCYLDHPGLIGLIGRVLAHSGAPSPREAHLLTSLVATAVPWLFVAMARPIATSPTRLYQFGLAWALCPTIAIGLFGFTPDVVLAPVWIVTIGMLVRALDPKEVDGASARTAWVVAGVAAGAGAAAKASGLLLVVAVAIAALFARRWTKSRTPWAFIGLACALLAASGPYIYDARSGFRMWIHRLVGTQSDAGVSLQNVGQVVGGQLAYLSPAIAALLAWGLVKMVRDRDRDAIDRWLFVVVAWPIAMLLALSVWSRVAEPHWLAPAWVGTAFYLVRHDRHFASMPAWLRKSALPLAAALTVFAHAWVLSPWVAARMPVPDRANIARELYGWPDVVDAVEEDIALERHVPPVTVAVVGPHWTVCAQLRAGLSPEIPVGCMTPEGDDFDRWLPESTWMHFDKLIYVTDDRFDDEPPAALAGWHAVNARRIRLFRGGRAMRSFRVQLLERGAHARMGFAQPPG